MPSKAELNLIGVVWPVCLLQCNSELNRLYAGEEIDVIVKDPDVLKDLLIILERSSDHLVTTSKQGERYRLHILRL